MSKNLTEAIEAWFDCWGMNIEKVDEIYGARLQVGLEVKVRENVLNRIKNNTYIQENFKLNIKKLNRWSYSIYFDELPNKQGG